MKKMPKSMFVYVCDELDDGTPVYAVVKDINDIPEDADGDNVGVYSLNRQCKLRVRRELS